MAAEVEEIKQSIKNKSKAIFNYLEYTCIKGSIVVCTVK